MNCHQIHSKQKHRGDCFSSPVVPDVLEEVEGLL